MATGSVFDPFAVAAQADEPMLSPTQNTPVFSGQGLDSYELSVSGTNSELQYIKSNTSLQVFGFYIGGDTQADVLHRPGAGGWYRLNALKAQNWKFAPIWVGMTRTNGICNGTTTPIT